MEKENLREIVKKEGFENIDDFIKANLHYLPENKQRLFNMMTADTSEKKYSQGAYYGKN